VAAGAAVGTGARGRVGLAAMIAAAARTADLPPDPDRGVRDQEVRDWNVPHSGAGWWYGSDPPESAGDVLAADGARLPVTVACR